MNHPLHLKAISLAQDLKRIEAELIDVLQKISASRLFKTMGYSSLFEYATKALGLTEGVAYGFISVSRKSNEVPALKEAIASGSVTVSQVRRVAAVMTVQNASELIQKVQSLTQKEIEREVARINPKTATPERAKYVTEERVELRFGASESFMKKLKRVQDLVAQKQRAHAGYEASLETALDYYLEKNDPAKRAERILEKKPNSESSRSKTDTCEATLSATILSSRTVGRNMNSDRSFRVTLPAKTKHIVFRRDQGRCTFVHPNGSRCDQARWLEVHHLRPVALGGDNSIDNLATLCSSHHRRLHNH